MKLRIFILLILFVSVKGVYSFDSTDVKTDTSTKIIYYIRWIEEKRDTAIRNRNIIGFNLYYIYKSVFGGGVGIYKRLSNDADFIAFLNFHSAGDYRTLSVLDSTGNPQASERESRALTFSLNVGLEKYFMQNNTHSKFKPTLIFGIAPALVLATPYEVGFFKSIFKTKLSYGLGVFGGFGVDYHASSKLSFSLSFRYSFIPVLGRDVYYFKAKPIPNLGGITATLGVNLMKPMPQR